MAKDYLVGILFLKKNNIYKNLLTLATEAFLEIFARERENEPRCRHFAARSLFREGKFLEKTLGAGLDYYTLLQNWIF